MPEDEKGKGLEDEETPEPEQEAPEPEEGDEEDEFDAERAMATIKNQRSAERELKKQLAAVRKQVEQFEAEEKKRERAKLSEIEKAQAELAEVQASHAETVALLNEMRLLMAFSRTAEVEGVAFANPQARQDAFALMDLSEITIDGEGQVDAKAMEKAIKALQKSRPHLFVEEEQEGGMGTPRRPSKRLPAPEGKEERPLRPAVQF